MLPIDFAANARSLGADVIECKTSQDYANAIAAARESTRTTVIYIENDRYESVPGYESWWDVPVSEESEMPSVREAYKKWREMKAKERYFI
jgi:3D-(3,5/4)-trihydroxycyclohexane-1,2-dione acylhydrolase (decyclizing)